MHDAICNLYMLQLINIESWKDLDRCFAESYLLAFSRLA